MKKKAKIVWLFLAAMLVFVACSNKRQESSEAAGSTETGITEETITAKSAAAENISEETVSTEIVSLLLEEKPEVAAVSVKEQAEEDTVEVTIYYGKSTATQLDTQLIYVEEVTPENLLSALAKHNIVSMDTKVNALEEIEMSGQKVLKLDMSSSFKEYLCTMTPECETIIVTSLADTFIEAYDVDAILFTIKGEALKTKNAAYENTISFTTLIHVEAEDM